MSRFRIALITLIASSLSTAAVADEWDRPGWYVGAGGGVATDFLDDAIEDAAGGLVNLSSGGTFNARGGYRLFSWLAFEAMYEGSYGLGIEVAVLPDVAESNFHSFLANGKLIIPTWRLHPYFILGIGAQYGTFNGTGPILGGEDLNRWDFVLRPGIGLDSYITENWVLNLELAPSLRVATYSKIPKETTDNLTLTFSAGVQYRF